MHVAATINTPALIPPLAFFWLSTKPVRLCRYYPDNIPQLESFFVIKKKKRKRKRHIYQVYFSLPRLFFSTSLASNWCSLQSSSSHHLLPSGARLTANSSFSVFTPAQLAYGEEISTILQQTTEGIAFTSLLKNRNGLLSELVMKLPTSQVRKSLCNTVCWVAIKAVYTAMIVLP